MHEAKFRAGWEAVNRGDVDAVLDLVHPSIVWDMSAGFLDGTVYAGHDGVRAFFADVAKLWQEFRLEINEIVERDDAVAILGSWSAHGRESAAPVRSPGGWYWRLTDGRATVMRFYTDPWQAVEALEGDTDATSAAARVRSPRGPRLRDPHAARAPATTHARRRSRGPGIGA